MVKCIFTVSFRSDLDQGAALRHWREVHAPLITQVAGVTRFTQNIASQQLAPAWDGVAEIWFESAASYEEAVKSPEWNVVLADCPKFMDMSKLGAAVVDEVMILQ
ncbi:EthD family reductase [Subtercola lobariae]|uniref:EthD domain-containing protein n=1 Tax=Subtercola lobariae TaxID=1588641 RepID=A0A917EY55_9MICO|nr:EthD family reductase [Subtercola lobariae]GGF23353.1 hypothetical protein GCM10011399_16160 [Subtercola lobariae]